MVKHITNRNIYIVETPYNIVWKSQFINGYEKNSTIGKKKKLHKPFFPLSFTAAKKKTFFF